MSETILKLIENVDPGDTNTLDKIDALTFVYTRQNESAVTHPQYTRSRDALKAIRPGGWWFDMEVTIIGKEWVYSCGLPNFIDTDSLVESKPLPTEELAELHAIIQAIEYERGFG